MTTDQPSLFGDLFEHREFHPIAQRLLPLAPTDEQVIDGIAESILRVGLINPSTLHPDGRIIDGRLRYLACRRAGVEPSYATLPSFYTEPMILDFLVSKNLRRSHLNLDQRAIIMPTTRPAVKRRLGGGHRDQHPTRHEFNRGRTACRSAHDRR